MRFTRREAIGSMAAATSASVTLANNRIGNMQDPTVPLEVPAQPARPPVIAERRAEAAATAANFNPPPIPDEPARVAPAYTHPGLSGASDASNLKHQLDARHSYTATLPDADIDKSLVFSRMPLDDSYRWNHADVLVHQGADLLERALAARGEWQEKYLKYHTFLFELEQFEAVDTIHKVEEAAGFYDVDKAMAEADYAALGALVKYTGNARYRLDVLTDRMINQRSQQLSWAGLTGWLSHRNAYTDSIPNAKASWSNVEKRIVEYSFEAASGQARYQFSNELDRMVGEFESKTGELESLKARVASLRMKAEWEAKNREFRRTRTAAIRELYEQKRKTLGEAEGGLNFLEQLLSLQRRTQRDFRDGLARAGAAAQGMRTIFGYDRVIPASVQGALAGDGSVGMAGVLDDAVEWLRDASSWLLRFGERDTTHSPSFSLQSLLGTGGWDNFRTTGSAQFAVTEQMFPQQSHVRLRGLSLHTLGLNGICAAQLQAPAASYYRHLGGNQVGVTQSDVGHLRIGAVRHYQSARGPEVAGSNSGYNVSPFGQWSITLTPVSSATGGLDQVSDVIIEMTVSSRSS